MKKNRLISFILLLTVFINHVQIKAQDLCTIYGTSATFDKTTVNGNIVTNPQGDVSINVKYTIPEKQIKE